MWIKIAGILLRNRVAFIIGVLLITVFMGFQIPKVEMSYEYSNLLPATDSAYLGLPRFSREIRAGRKRDGLCHTGQRLLPARQNE